MKQFLLLGAAVAALAGSSTLAYLSKAPPPADVAVFPAAHDFGTVRQKTSHNAEFTIRNETSARVKIERVVKSCDCSKPKLEKTALAPGEETKLTVQWDVGTRHGPSGTYFDLVTSSAGRGSEFQFLRVNLRANVLSSFALVPESITFQRDGGPQERPVAFEPNSTQEQAIKLLAVTTTHLALEANLASDGRGFVMLFSPDRWPTDRQTAELIVETSSAIEGSRTLAVNVH